MEKHKFALTDSRGKCEKDVGDFLELFFQNMVNAEY
jgi:hypothetical protein